MKKYLPIVVFFILSLVVATSPLVPGLKGLWGDVSDLTKMTEKLVTCLGILFAILGSTLGLQLAFTQTKIEDVNQNVQNSIDVHDKITKVPSEKFYPDFLSSMNSAKRSICISYLAPFPPSLPGKKQRNEYYDSVLRLIKSKGQNGVVCRRLIRWSEENRPWIESMLSQLSKVPDFELAILHDTDEVEVMPLSLSVQLIDDRQTWLVAARDHEQKDYYRDLHIESETFNRYIQDYFERLWRRAEVLKDSSRGITTAGSQLINRTYRNPGGLK